MSDLNDVVIKAPPPRDAFASYALITGLCIVHLLFLGLAVTVTALNPSIYSWGMLIVYLIIVGGLFAAMLEDVGWIMIDRWRQYDLGGRILRITHILYQIFPSGCASMGALRLGQRALLLSNIQEADRWAGACLRIAPRDIWACRVYAHTLKGEVRFHQGLFEEARSEFKSAIEARNGGNAWSGAAVLNKADFFLAQAYNILGRMALAEGKLTEAERSFAESYRLQTIVPSLYLSAVAYKSFTGALLLETRLNHDDARAGFINALNAFPKEGKTCSEQRALAVEIAEKVITLSEEGDLEWLAAHDLIARMNESGLHPSILERAALIGQKRD